MGIGVGDASVVVLVCNSRAGECCARTTPLRLMTFIRASLVNQGLGSGSLEPRTPLPTGGPEPR